MTDRDWRTLHLLLAGIDPGEPEGEPEEIESHPTPEHIQETLQQIQALDL